LRHDDDETGEVYGLDDEPLEPDDVDLVDDEPEIEADPEAGAQTDPQNIYGVVSRQQVTEALEACRQGLDSPSDLLKRVALEKAITVMEAVLNAA
jgi:hypothetical protein